MQIAIKSNTKMKYKSLKVLSSHCEGEPARLVKEKIPSQMGLAAYREGVKSSYTLSTLRFSKLRFPEAVHTVGFILNFIFMLHEKCDTSLLFFHWI